MAFKTTSIPFRRPIWRSYDHRLGGCAAPLRRGANLFSLTQNIDFARMGWKGACPARSFNTSPLTPLSYTPDGATSKLQLHPACGTSNGPAHSAVAILSNAHTGSSPDGKCGRTEYSRSTCSRRRDRIRQRGRKRDSGLTQRRFHSHQLTPQYASSSEKATRAGTDNPENGVAPLPSKALGIGPGATSLVYDHKWKSCVWEQDSMALSLETRTPRYRATSDMERQTMPASCSDGVQTSFSRGAHRKAYEKNLPGGVVHEVQGVSSFALDVTAERQVEVFLQREWSRQQTAQAKSEPVACASNRTNALPRKIILSVPGTTLKRAVVSFQINGRSLLAIGQSTRAKTARVLSFMHAVKLIDHYAVQDKAGVTLPPPLPFQEDLSSQNVLRRLPQRSQIHPYQFKTWDAYIAASKAYIRDREVLARESALRAMRIPPCSNALVNYATRLVQGNQGEFCATPENTRLALQYLNNEVRDANHYFQVSQVERKIFVATLPLEASQDLVATGVGRSSKEAKQRCALHARCILRLLNEQHRAGREAPASERAGGGPLCTLSPHYATLYELFCFLFEDAKNRELHFEKEGSNFRCKLTLSGISCVGSGINRFEAERAAIQTALGELELRDERLQALNTFMGQYPSVTSAKIPTAVLPAALCERIRSAAELISKETISPDTHGCREAIHPTSAAAGGRGGFSEEALGARWQGVDHSEAYAETLRRRLCALRVNAMYLAKYHPRRSTLAMASVEQQVVDTVAANRVTIICGTTGCGKTTQVPQYLWDHEIMAGRGDRCNIVVTQPRRITSFSVADRIAQERLGVIGDDVGYAVRLDSKPGRHITLCTSGVLLQTLHLHPDLEHVSHLIIDEVHERDVNCDVMLALVKQILQRNDKIRVVLMSATMQSSLFAAYFDGAPVISVEGAIYPVQVRYLEDIATLAARPALGLRVFRSPMFDLVNKPRRLVRLHAPHKTDYQLIAYLVHYSIRVDMQDDPSGKSILIFLPGWKELLSAQKAIETLDSIYADPGVSNKIRFKIILLHSTVDTAKQRHCFESAPAGYVKVVLATNIAESGITIDDAAVVIDTGLIKQTSWVARASTSSWVEVGDQAAKTDDAHTASFSTQLALTYVSQANATQRKGRAGRTQGGVCYRLFTRQTWDVLSPFPVPEIHRLPLTQVLLKLLSLGYNAPRDTIATFIEPPALANVEASMTQIKHLGAVTADEKLTSLGRYLSKLPCDPRIGKMIMMGAVLHCLDSVLTVAATADVCPFLTSRDTSAEVRKRRYMFSRGSQSDHISFLNAYNGFCVSREDDNFARFNLLHRGNLGVISRYKAQYCDILCRSGLINPEELRPCGSSTEDSNGGSLWVDTSPLSADASSVSLVKACLCAALFPNVAVLEPLSLFELQKRNSGSGSGKLKLRTKAHGSITPATDSACRRLGSPREHGIPSMRELFEEFTTQRKPLSHDNPTVPAMFYVFQEVFAVREAGKVFLTSVSSISLWSLLLFGASEANVQYFELLGLCVVDGWIVVRIDPATFRAIRELRHTLHECVWCKYKDPLDEQNNSALRTLRELSKAVLQAPLDTEDPTLNRLVDSGVIVPPTSNCATRSRSV